MKNLCWFSIGFFSCFLVMAGAVSQKQQKIHEELRDCQIEVSSCKFACWLEIDALETLLDDPEHCLSVCVEQFEKYGC